MTFEQFVDRIDDLAREYFEMPGRREYLCITTNSALNDYYNKDFAPVEVFELEMMNGNYLSTP